MMDAFTNVHECKNMRESSETKGESLGEGHRGKHERKYNQPITWKQCPKSEEWFYPEIGSKDIFLFISKHP